MALELFANLPQTAVSSGGLGAPASGTSETWTVSSGGLFPSATLGATKFRVADVNPLYNSEIILVTATSGGTWTVTRGAEGTTPVGHAAGFTVTMVITATTLRELQRKPYQFFPESYGAKGDGKIAVDVTSTSGSAVIVSPTVAADPAAAGKTLMLNGGLSATGSPLIATIVSVAGSNVTLSANATATIASGGQAFWASDDTAAVNAAVTAAGAFATGAAGAGDGFGNYYAEVVFAAKFYGLASGPTQVVSPLFNAQVPLPYPNVNGSTQKLIIRLIGAGGNSHAGFWESTAPNLAATALVSLVKAPTTTDPTYGVQSVIGGPGGGGAFTGLFANTKVIIENLQVVCPPITDQYAYDFRYLTCAGVYRSSAKVFTSVLGNSPTIASLPGNGTFQARHSIGLAMPVTGNNADSDVDTFCVEGFTTGVQVADTFNARRVLAFYCGICMKADLSLGLSNKLSAICVLDYIAGQSNSAFTCSSGSGGLVPVYLFMTTEGINTAHLQDSGNQMVGLIHWNDTGTSTPTLTGGTQVKFINDRAQLGYWSGAPAVPATTVAAAVVYRDASIVVTTGAGVTVSAVTIDGQATGLTMAQSSSLTLPVVPAGKTIALTYAGGTPAWTWYLT